MTAIAVNRKRGRPPTGRTLIGVRMLPEELAALDAWRAEQEPEPTRPEAIRTLLTKALPAPNTTTIRGEFD